MLHFWHFDTLKFCFYNECMTMMAYSYAHLRNHGSSSLQDWSCACTCNQICMNFVVWHTVLKTDSDITSFFILCTVATSWSKKEFTVQLIMAIRAVHGSVHAWFVALNLHHYKFKYVLCVSEIIHVFIASVNLKICYECKNKVQYQLCIILNTNIHCNYTCNAKYYTTYT